MATVQGSHDAGGGGRRCTDGANMAVNNAKETALANPIPANPISSIAPVALLASVVVSVCVALSLVE